MKPALVNRKDYCQYLLATFANYTGSYLAQQLGCCHDAVTDFLSRDRLTPRLLWDRVSEHLPSEQRSGGVLVLDDSVLDKRYARRIELARRQWSGNAKQVIYGIGWVNWLYLLPVAPPPAQSLEEEVPVYLLVDYRLFDPEAMTSPSTTTHGRCWRGLCTAGDLLPLGSPWIPGMLL